MLAKLCERVSHWLVAKGLDEKERPVYAYGLQVAIETIGNMITTVLIGLVFGQVLESVVFLAGYCALRTYAGGFHTETALRCYVASCALVAGVLLFCKIYPLSYAWVMILPTVAATALIAALAPVAATHKPLDAEEYIYYRKHCRRRLCVEVAVLLVFVLIGQLRLALVLSTGLCLVAFFMVLGRYKNKRMLGTKEALI